MKTVWSPSFFPVLITYFIDNFGLAIVYPIFARLFLKDSLPFLEGDPTFTGRLLLLGGMIASFPLAQFFGAPLLGEISDRIGRKKVFLTTILGGVLGYLLTGIGVYFKNLPTLFFGRLLAGFFAGNLTLCLAAIADISQSKKERTRNFGWVGTLGGISFVLAILVGGSLSNPDLSTFFRPDIPFFVVALFAAINWFLMWKYFKESRKLKPHNRIDFLRGVRNIALAIQTKGLRLIYAVYFLFMVCWITSMQFLSAFLIETYQVRINTITVTFAFIGITWSFANFIINPILSGLVRPIKTLLISLSALTLFLFLTLLPGEPLFLFLVHFFLATLFAALCWTNGLATVSASASQHTQGSILGMNQSVVAIATIVGPIAGALIGGYNIHILYLFTGLCSLLGALLLFIRSFAISNKV